MENSVNTKHSNIRALKVYMSVYLCRNFSNKMWLSCKNKKKIQVLVAEDAECSFLCKEMCTL